MNAIARAQIVLIGLIAATAVSLVLTTPSIVDAFGARQVGATAALIAFVKAHFVARDFMELRKHPELMCLFNVWFAVVGVGALVLFIR